jgi:hypothetical protein
MIGVATLSGIAGWVNVTIQVNIAILPHLRVTGGEFQLLLLNHPMHGLANIAKQCIVLC